MSGLSYKWRERNQFPFDVAFMEYERKANQEAAANNGSGMTLNLDSLASSGSPGIVVVGIPVPPLP